jgi:hypothetical protein
METQRGNIDPAVSGYCKNFNVSATSAAPWVITTNFDDEVSVLPKVSKCPQVNPLSRFDEVRENPALE